MARVIQTLGGLIDLDNPDFSDHTLDHFLDHLLSLNRFTGAGYSVAHHTLAGSVLLETLAPNDLESQRAWLFHDFHEIVTGDVPSPLERIIDMHTGGLLAKIKRDLDHAIYLRFGLDVPRVSIRWIDTALGNAEAWQTFGDIVWAPRDIDVVRLVEDVRGYSDALVRAALTSRIREVARP